MNYLRILSLAVIALSIVSCKTHYKIAVTNPAPINLPDEAKTIGVINNIKTVQKGSDVTITQVLDPEQIKGNKAAAERAVDGVISSLTNSKDMMAQTFAHDSMYLDDGSLDWNFIDSLGKLQGIDAFIELNELRTVAPAGGTLVSTQTGQASQKLEGWMYINVHVVSTGETFERWELYDRYLIRNTGSSSNPIDLIGNVQKKQEYYRKLGFNLGFEAGELVYDHRVWANRMYFKSGSPSLKAAKHNMRQGNWDAAEKQLMHDMDNGDPKARGRILYNLAVVKEGQGDLDMAIQYAEKSSVECYNKDASQYLATLQQRKRTLELRQ